MTNSVKCCSPMGKLHTVTADPKPHVNLGDHMMLSTQASVAAGGPISQMSKLRLRETEVKQPLQNQTT